MSTKIRAWALVNVEVDEGQYTPRGESFIVFSFAGGGVVPVEPRLQVFDVRHREYAERKREEWSRVFPDCRVVPCTIVLDD